MYFQSDPAPMLCAGAVFALLPTLAHRLGAGAIGYGLLLGCFGGGAIAGAVLMQRVTARWSREAVASSAVAVLGLMTVIMTRPPAGADAPVQRTSARIQTDRAVV